MAYRWILKPQFILIVPVLLLMLTAVACGSDETDPATDPAADPNPNRRCGYSAAGHFRAVRRGYR